jgi:uncharacterized RDD family membrane protein YckC
VDTIPTPQKQGGADSLKVLRAGFWRRAAAWIIDYISSFFIAYALGFVSSLAGVFYTDNEIIGISVLIWWLYFALQESGTKQATVGKQYLSIKVVTLDGKAPTFWRSSGRHFAKFLSAIPLGIGFLMCIFTARKQCRSEEHTSELQSP